MSASDRRNVINEDEYFINSQDEEESSFSSSGRGDGGADIEGKWGCPPPRDQRLSYSFEYGGLLMELRIVPLSSCLSGPCEVPRYLLRFVQHHRSRRKRAYFYVFKLYRFYKVQS